MPRWPILPDIPVHAIHRSIPALKGQLTQNIFFSFLKDARFIVRLMMVLLITALLLYLAYCSLLYKFQDHLIFKPPVQKGPTDYQVNKLVKIDYSITVDGKKQNGLLFKRTGQSKLLFYLPGNSSNMATLKEKVTGLAQLFNSSILLIDYPGYGQSEGKPSEVTIYGVLAPWVSFMTAELQITTTDILLWGHSLGGGVACELAGRYPFAGLILEGTFTSIPNMATIRHPLAPSKWLCKSKFDNESKLQNLQGPILILHSQEDKSVPFEQFKQLQIQLQNRPNIRFLATNGTHDDTIFTSKTSIFETCEDLFPGWMHKGLN